MCLAQCEQDAHNLPGEVALLKTITARCCPQNTTSPALKCHPVAVKLLSLGAVVSEGQVCALPSPQLCSVPFGILQIPRAAPLPVCVSPTLSLTRQRCHGWVTCSRVPFILFSPSFLSLCLHGCSLGATEPPQIFLHLTGRLPSLLCSFQLLFPQAASQRSSRTGTLPWDISCVPSPRASSCLPAHKLCMPRHWGVSGIQFLNSRIADFRSFSLFTCFCPRAKQLQPHMGWCSGSGGSLAAPAHSPREQNSRCLAASPVRDPPSDLLPVCLGFSISRGSLLPSFHSCPTRVCWQEGWNQAGVPQEAAIPDSVQKLLSKALCVSPVSPLKPAEPLGPCWVIPVVGGLRNRRLWKPPVPCTP